MGDASPGPALYVATDLDRFETSEPQVLAPDVTISGRCYRRLDPPYYAWLRSRVVAAKRALDAGRLATAAFEALRAGFNAIHTWAVKHLGEAALVAAARAFNPKVYVPPRADDDDFDGARVPHPATPGGPSSGHRFPPRGAWPFTQPVSPDAVAKVDAVRGRALALGWSEAALFQNRGHLAFPVGGEWGLVCFLDEGATVGAVAREAITIEHARGAAMQFPNRDVAQPWRRTAEAVCA